MCMAIVRGVCVVVSEEIQVHLEAGSKTGHLRKELRFKKHDRRVRERVFGRLYRNGDGEADWARLRQRGQISGVGYYKPA